uniref:Gibberellin 2-beta-dioxygenase 8-like n=1 Tax=Ananas comosus var. bracteatus TaxID=296719 RepID=A0A6V7QKZ5_ANACO|nr:unnamed protein product [Ananas comosus var. bracteatus]
MTPKIMKGSNSVSDPPLAHSYRSLLLHELENTPHYSFERDHEVVGECELPLIDLTSLSERNGRERRACVEAMAKASSEWGFFQVVNHGISHELLKEMKQEQVKLFRLPFETKVESKLLNDSYRWGTPTATSAKQFSWSEAFHVPLAKISEDSNYGEFSSLREVMEKLAVAMSELARTLARVLAENLGYSRRSTFPENCDESTCFLRLNRYPPCPFAPGTFGLMPHTDSDFLTILYQDQVGACSS